MSAGAVGYNDVDTWARSLNFPCFAPSAVAQSI